MLNRLFAVLIVVTALAIAQLSLYQNTYLPAFHDQYQAERVYEISTAIAFGQLPPRYVQNLGYGLGYPLFNFYAPLPYYLGTLFYLLGFELIFATKLMISFGFMLAFATMYYTAHRWWGRGGALLSAILYTFAPYHAVQLYVRGSIGELYAYALLPLVFLGVYEIFRRAPSWRQISIAAIGTTLLFISHTVSLYMIALVLFDIALVYLCFKIWQKHQHKKSIDIRPAIAFFTLPLLVSAYFWLPAFTELKYTMLSIDSGNEVNYRDHFVSLGQLWDSAWGYAGSSAEADGMSFMLGKLSIIIALGVIVLALFTIKRHSNKHKYFAPRLIALSAALLVAIFSMLSISDPVWQITPYSNLIQFPWRFLMVASVLIALLCGALIPLIRPFVQSKFYPPVTLLILVTTTYQLLFPLSIPSSIESKFFRAQSYYPKTSSEITDLAHLQGEVSAVSDEFLYHNIPTSLLADELVGVTCTALCRIHQEVITPDRYSYQVEFASAGTLVIPKANFPGFKSFINQNHVDIIERNGLISLPIDRPGLHQIEIQLFDTLPRALGNIITVTTILGIIVYLLVQKELNVKHRRP